MKTTALVAVIGSAVLLGCQHTVQGLAQDTKSNAREAAAKSSQAIEQATVASRDATAAVSLAAPIKLAIDGDAELSAPKNEISVSADDKSVNITGHVQSEKERQKVDMIVSKVLKDHEAKQTIHDDLVVQG